MQRDIFTEEHEAFRDTVRSFIAKEVAPYHEQWEKDGVVSRDVWLAAGRAGLLGIDIDEQYGGGGEPDYRYYVVLGEELARAGVHGPGFAVHNDIIGPYLDRPRHRRAEASAGCPATAPASSSPPSRCPSPARARDLQGIRTTAVATATTTSSTAARPSSPTASCPTSSIVVARTDPRAATRASACWWSSAAWRASSAAATSTRSAMHAQDTAELFFNDVRVPAANLLGEEGRGFVHLMQNLPRERLAIGVAALAGAEQAVRDHRWSTASDREAFGRPIGSFQHNRFALAEMATELRRGAGLHSTAASPSTSTASSPPRRPRWPSGGPPSCSKRVVDRCLQLHGGYGYMTSTRSPGPSPTPGSRPSSAARPRS